MELSTTGGTTLPATRQEVVTFVCKADELGHSSMGTAALLAFELCQREGDVLGTMTWGDYRSGVEIRIRQHKTKKMVWVPLADEEGPLYLGLIERLDSTTRRGPLIVMRDTPDRHSKAYLPYKKEHFRHLFRDIANQAGLRKDFTFMSLRHGGLTELGDAGATDQELMSLSGHRTRQTLSVYTKPTADQARSAARKRRHSRTNSAQSSE